MWTEIMLLIRINIYGGISLPYACAYVSLHYGGGGACG